MGERREDDPGSGGAFPIARLLLDACCLLNLFASQRVEQVLLAVAVHVGVVSAVAGEALYVRRGGAGDDADEREPVLLQPLVAAGYVEVLHPETDAEFASFVHFAAQLDDGEAMTCALALHCGYRVATDDRKALRVLREQSPPVPAVTTSELVKAWVDATQPAAADLVRVLTDIRERARFVPSRRDPHHAWWLGLLTAD